MSLDDTFITKKKLKNYRGNYDTMLKTEEYTMVGQIKDHDTLEKRIKRIKRMDE